MGTNEGKVPETDRVTESIAGAMHQTWLAGLGLVAVVAEETGHLLGTLVAKGKQVEPNVIEQGKKLSQEVSQAVGDMGAKLKGFVRMPEGAEAALDERVAATLDRMGFPRKEELQALSAKIDALTARLEQIRGGSQ
jgi:poly(hydroxyalkanoate) granule-associated protein